MACPAIFRKRYTLALPKHRYEVQRFYDSSDRNLYNYVVMYDKGHEVAPMDAVLGWNYVRAFRRLSDGTLKQLA